MLIAQLGPDAREGPSDARSVRVVEFEELHAVQPKDLDRLVPLGTPAPRDGRPVRTDAKEPDVFLRILGCGIDQEWTLPSRGQLLRFQRDIVKFGRGSAPQ